MYESKCFEESQEHLDALEVLLSLLYDTAPATLIFCSLHERPGNDCQGLYGGAWGAAEHKSSCCCHMKICGAPILQHGFNLPARWWSPERQMICNKTWCLPFGAENPIWSRSEKEHQTFLCWNMMLFWFFSLLFHAHFSYLNSSLMSPTFPFSVHMWVFTHAYHFKDKFLNLQGVGPNGSSILVKLIYHQDQSKSLLQDIFLGGFPGTCFSFPCFWRGRSFPVSVVSCFPHCSCAVYGLKPRILMELLCHWRFLCPVWYFPLLSSRFLNFFLFLSFLLISIVPVPC